jgi:hypothetical protein
VVTVTLEVASTLPLRFYQNHFSSQRIYGGLNAVVDLLLRLYFTGAAIFIGGEAHSEIEKSAAEALRAHVGGSAERRSGGKERYQQLAGRFGGKPGPPSCELPKRMFQEACHASKVGKVVRRVD